MYGVCNLSKMSAADMFALTKRGSVSFSPKNKLSKNNNAISKMVSKAVLAASVMLATQLEAKEKEDKTTSALDDQTTGSLGASDGGQTQFEDLSNGVDRVLGSAVSEVASLVGQAPLATQASVSIATPTSAAVTENGLPQSFVTQTPAVTDPAQLTREFPEDVQTFETGRTNITSGSSGSTPFAGLNGEDGEDGQDGANGRDGIDGQDGTNGTNGIDGQDGANGRDGIDGQDGANGTNGIDGQDGANGTNGIDGQDGLNGTNGINGQDGANGRDGIDGQDGLNGTNGIDGQDGANGRDGIDGQDGANGRDGIDGQDGANGTNGINGQDGTNGTNGIDGQDGANGRDGIDGQDGLNGTNGIDGQDGANGRDGIDGQDGKITLLLDGDLFDAADLSDLLVSQGVAVTDGPLGTVAITADADQLSDITNLINSLAPPATNDENFIHGASPISGSDQEDFLVGTDGDDILSSLGANDILIGGIGSDTLLGGEGNDTASYFSSSEGVNVNLTTDENTGGDAFDDVLISIENLIGSNFEDNLIGDDKDNHLSGGQGSDTLMGGGNTDLLHGGAGGDLLDGGSANDDVATYFDSDASVSISLFEDLAFGGHAEGDELDNIEFVDGSLFDDFIQGDNQVNRIGGLFGEDVLLGEGGNDILLGGNSGDYLDGGEGIDTSDYTASLEGVNVNLATGESRFGEAEGDTIISIENLAGSSFNDVLTGDDQVNRLTGRDGDDVLVGNGGNDRLVGGLGADELDGGEGTRDAADYSAAEEAVGVDLIAGGFAGEADGDTFTGVEFIVGSEHHDNLLGDDGINRINGGDGCDVIFGRGGNDVLLGEEGDDILNGGSGNDVFIFSEGDGNDIIEDFEAGAGRTDRVRLLNEDFEDFDAVQSAITDTDEGALLTLDNGSILFQNINAADFVADDFILG